MEIGVSFVLTLILTSLTSSPITGHPRMSQGEYQNNRPHHRRSSSSGSGSSSDSSSSESSSSGSSSNAGDQRQAPGGAVGHVSGKAMPHEYAQGEYIIDPNRKSSSSSSNSSDDDYLNDRLPAGPVYYNSGKSSSDEDGEGHKKFKRNSIGGGAGSGGSAGVPGGRPKPAMAMPTTAHVNEKPTTTGAVKKQK